MAKKRVNRLQKTRIQMAKLWEDGHRNCHYCKTITTNQSSKKLRGKDWTLDHVVPRSQGGSDKMDNMVLACYSCNRLRGVIPYDIFLSHVYDESSCLEFKLKGKYKLSTHNIENNRRKSMEKMLSNKKKAFMLYLMDKYNLISLKAVYNYFNTLRDIKFDNLNSACTVQV